MSRPSVMTPSELRVTALLHTAGRLSAHQFSVHITMTRSLTQSLSQPDSQPQPPAYLPSSRTIPPDPTRKPQRDHIRFTYNTSEPRATSKTNRASEKEVVRGMRLASGNQPVSRCGVYSRSTCGTKTAAAPPALPDSWVTGLWH